MLHNKNERVMILKGLNDQHFLFEASSLLTESLEDPDVTPEEHNQLFLLFLEKADDLFPSLENHEKAYLKNICWIKYSKNEVKKRETLREQLVFQIENGDLCNVNGRISPETLWDVICFQSPELKDRYDLDSEYQGEKDSILCATVILTSTNLKMWSDRTIHLRK